MPLTIQTLMRRRAMRLAARLAALLAIVAPATPLHAQGWMKRVKQAAKEAAESVDRRPAAAAQPAQPAPPAQAPDAAPDAATGATATGPAAVWANYDFVPGARPLYVDDFSGDNVGDFPKRLKWENGNFEVAEANGRRWLRATSFGWFSIPLPEVLPERFTLEMDMIAPSGWSQEIYFGPRARGNGQPRVVMAPDRGGMKVNGEPTYAAPPRPYRGTPIPVRVMADGQHVKVYMGETRVANIPQVDLGRDRAIRIGVSGSTTDPMMIAGIRVMAGGRALYDALAESGRVATQGILFDVGSDRIRPESAPTLKEIAAMLAAHPDLSLAIEGHTDDVGAAAANQALSETRAAAVKAALVATHGIDEARLTARGLGATKPAAPNTTAEGRAANRRVELVRR